MPESRPPLHPQVKVLFDMMGANRAQRVLEPAPMREGLGALGPLLVAGAPSVAAERELQIPGPAGKLRVRVFNPSDPAGAPRPVIVYFHGGGYVVMSPETHEKLTKQLCVGVGAVVVSVDYRLALAAKDARDFAAALRPQEGKQYRKVHLRVLTDRDATRVGITKAFEWLHQSVGANDVAMLFMAGHGLNDGLGQYHFLPADGQHERLAATALSQGTIVSTLAKVRGKTLLFLDTCFAGNTLGALSRVGRQTEKMMNDLSSSENGVVVFASSTGQEESEEKAEWGNGAFTKVLIEGLAGKADFTGVGRVTFAALNLFLSEGVARLTQGRQRPVFISPRGVPDFALVRL